MQSISPYSVQMRENTNQNNFKYGYAVFDLHTFWDNKVWYQGQKSKL